ncbi:MAG: hypothetical protein JWO63_1679, partial [Frankiales bacterium]|nr:hypothetical protein [Frankiales bacterium]
MAERWLIRDVLIPGFDGRLDCRLAEGRIAEIGPELALGTGEQVLAAGGGELLPGLSDHHVHLFASAAALDSIDLAGGHDLAAARPID